MDPSALGRCLLALLGMLWAAGANPRTAAAEPPRDEKTAALGLDQRRTAVARPAMWTLGAWSVANLGVGTVGTLAASDPRWKAFHQGNAAWNTVNLGIAGLSLWSLQREEPGAGGLDAARRRSQSLSLALAVNAGLDVVYVAGGGWLWERGVRTGNPRQIGLGQALILQGGALLIFDLTVLRLHRRQSAFRPTVTPTSGGGLLGVGGHF